MTKLAGECSSWAIHKLGVLGACVCRKYWEEESGKKGDRLDVESMIGTGAGTEHEMLLEACESVVRHIVWGHEGGSMLVASSGQFEQ